MTIQAFELDIHNHQFDTQVAERFAREIYVVGSGIGSGLVKEIHDHPQQCAEKIGTAVVGGAVLGAAATAELPALAIGATGVGAVMAGKYVWDLVDPNSPSNQRRNASLQSAASTAWLTRDQAQLNRAIHNISDTCGPTAVDLLAGIAGGSAARLGAAAPAYFVRFADPAPNSSYVPDCFARFAVPTLTPAYAPTLGGSAEILPPVDPSATSGGSTESPAHLTDFVNFIKRHGPVHSRPNFDNEPSEMVPKSSEREEITLVETEDAITASYRGNWYRQNKYTGKYSFGNATEPLGEPNGPPDFDSRENGTRAAFFKDKH